VIRGKSNVAFIFYHAVGSYCGGGKQPKARPPPLSRQLPNGSSAARAVITIEIDTITRNIAPKGYHPKASDL